MKLYLTFSGEGPTDHRFIPIIIERLIQDFLIKEGVEAEFSWITVPKKGSSHDNILNACAAAKNYHFVLFHRDSGNNTWQQAYANHFSSAVNVLKSDNKDQYNKNLIPVIPITEIEAWMLCNKETLKSQIETELSDDNLSLTYQINRIESISDPKSVVQKAISKHLATLTPKQQRYAVKIGDLYDSIAAEMPIEDLNRLSAFTKLKEDLNQVLKRIAVNS